MAAKDASDGSHPLFIKELIRRVDDELRASRREREAAGDDPIFEVQTLTLEVNFVVVESKGIKGGIDFKVITAGGDRSFQEQQVQKVTLTLSALAPPEPELKSPRKFTPA